MRQAVVDTFGQWTKLAVLVALVIMLALLSWGISASDLWASMLAGALLAAVIVVGGSVVLVPDNLRSQATERTMRMAASTFEHMRGGLTPESCNAVCQIILPETDANAVSLTDTKKVLAYVGERAPMYPPGSPNTKPTMEVIASGRMETFTTRETRRSMQEGFVMGEDDEEQAVTEGYPVTVIHPLVVADKVVGALKLYYLTGAQMDRTQMTIARGLASLLSAQLSSYELDRQAELTARAEIKALQAQINPHFLFNTLNTIASLTRTDPTRARELLREFSVFYRRTLEGTQDHITLRQELEQTRRYLTIEQARFGEDRIMEYERIEPGLEDIVVPAFLIQPIVENAVRHAMREEGTLHIDVHATTEQRDVLIAVADDGLGMDEEVSKLLTQEPEATRGGEAGTGIALRNVAERVERLYGVGSGVEVMSKLGEGTVVTLRLANAVPRGSRQATAQLIGS